MRKKDRTEKFLKFVPFNYFIFVKNIGKLSQNINIVFETLSNLQKGNRIVGIISHVEELQERIPKALFIKNDIDEGSLIEVVG